MKAIRRDACRPCERDILLDKLYRGALSNEEACKLSMLLTDEIAEEPRSERRLAYILLLARAELAIRFNKVEKHKKKDLVDSDGCGKP